MSSVTIKINNKEYNLKGDEKEEYLHTVANYVDKKIRRIMENNPRLSTAEASILTAMNLADDLFKCGEDNEKLFDQIEEFKAREKALNSEIVKLKDELTRVNEEKDELLFKNEELEAAIENENINDNSQGFGEVNLRSNDVEELNKQLNIMEEETKKYIAESQRVKTDNKQLKFNLQSTKYKLMDLEHKYLESQILLAKTKKEVVDSLREDGK